MYKSLTHPTFPRPSFQGEYNKTTKSTMCPPGVDQTTRTAQRWQLMAPELKQNMPLNRNFWGREDDDSEVKFMANLFCMLARPISTPKGSGISLPQHSQSCGSFDLLSNEIFDIILLHLDEKRDIIALGLTSIRMWHLVLHHIRAGYVAATAPLTGTRLIFQGSYSQDLPPAFTEDKAFVEKFVAPTQWEGYPVGGGIYARSFYWAHAEFPRAVTAQDQAEEYTEAINIHWEEARIGETELKVLERDLAVPGLEREGKSWVLRNLTTREIVCSEKLNEKGGRTGLEHVLLEQITWTSMLRSFSGDMSKYRGKWAGHRFDIVELSAHEKEGGDWEDVSAEKLSDGEQPDDW